MGAKMLAAFLPSFHLATLYLHVIIYYISVTTRLIYYTNAAVYFHLDTCLYHGNLHQDGVVIDTFLNYLYFVLLLIRLHKIYLQLIRIFKFTISCLHETTWTKMNYTLLACNSV